MQARFGGPSVSSGKLILLLVGLALLVRLFESIGRSDQPLNVQEDDQLSNVPQEAKAASHLSSTSGKLPTYKWPDAYNASALYPPLYDWRKHPTTFDLDKQLAPAKFSFRDSKTKADAQGMAAIREMMLHAWRPYREHAMGFDNYLPLSRSGGNWMCDNGAAGMAATLVDALGTLHIMGLKKEYDDAAEYMLRYVDFAKDSTCDMFETTIRVLGGLNSAHSLTGDPRYLEKAVVMGDALLKAFTTGQSGIPYLRVNLKRGDVRPGGIVLAGAASNIVEFAYLTDATGDPKYQAATDATLAAITKARTPGMPYPDRFDSTSGRAIGSPLYASLGSDRDSFFEYLLKGALLVRDPHEAAQYRAQYDEAIDFLLSYIVVNKHGQVNLAEGSINSGMRNFVQHLACFAGGMLMLGAVSQASPYRNQIFQIGLDYTETCYGLYHAWDKGVPPDEADLPNFTIRGPLSGYNQRPEVAESIFYAWRFTHDPKYRRWAMEIAKAINSTTRVEEGGFACISNAASSAKVDRQESFLLSETLKYLYLTFTDDDVMPLEKWVFNTEAHPVRRQQQ
ncbi:hypothetical protein RI367_008215 [Sorochytrium milnesiophthora]